MTLLLQLPATHVAATICSPIGRQAAAHSYWSGPGGHIFPSVLMEGRVRDSCEGQETFPSDTTGSRADSFPWAAAQSWDGREGDPACGGVQHRTHMAI